MPDLVWIFAYGSLMWRPGFPFLSFRSALLTGWHRSLCIRSTVHRGTPERPGLVLGLDRGGRCRGRAIGILPERETEVLTYLDERELVTDVYLRVRLPVELEDGRRVPAWCYVVRPEHEQYEGELPDAEIMERVCHGHGHAGPCREYVLQTVAHLHEMGIREPQLDRIARALSLETPASIP